MKFEGKVMKYKNFLRQTKVNEFTDLPYIENFMVCAKAKLGTELTSLYSYLHFLKEGLKEYNKRKNLISFEDFMNQYWPPEKKITCSDNADD